MERKKKFFKPRTVTEMKRLDFKDFGPIKSEQGLVERIRELDAETEGIVLDLKKTPEEYFHKKRKELSWDDASKAHEEEGPYLDIEAPATYSEARESVPLAVRLRDAFQQRTEDMRADEVPFLGWYWIPFEDEIGHPDKRARRIVFDDWGDMAAVYVYAHNITTTGIGFDAPSTYYVRPEEGATVHFRVPSRRERPLYEFTLRHIPVVPHPDSKIAACRLEPLGEVSPFERYKRRQRKDRRERDWVGITPHHGAGLFQFIVNYGKPELHNNRVPLNLSPIPFPSREMANFRWKVYNNILVRDESLKRTDKLRRAHRDTRSLLVAGAMKAVDNPFWESTERDGKWYQYSMEYREYPRMDLRKG